MSFRRCLAAGAFSLVAAAPVFAHHSSAMFDHTKQLTLEGTVKEWKFTAPHSWLMVEVRQQDGKAVVWALEGGGPSGKLRKDTFKPGDKITVVTHPMRDGRPAGLLGVVTLPDGRKVNEKPF